MKKKQNKRRWATAVFGGLFVAGVVLAIPYLVFWAINQLSGFQIDYVPMNLLAFWVLAVLLPKAIPPRKIYVAHI